MECCPTNIQLKTALLTTVFPKLGSLIDLPYCSIQSVITIFQNSTLVITTSTIPDSVYNLNRTFQVIKTFSIQRLILVTMITVIIQTWLWRIFYSIWQTYYFCFLIWHHQPDTVRCSYIPDYVLGSLFLPHGHGISSVSMLCSSGILLSSYSMRDNCFIFCTR